MLKAWVMVARPQPKRLRPLSSMPYAMAPLSPSFLASRDIS